MAGYCVTMPAADFQLPLPLVVQRLGQLMFHQSFFDRLTALNILQNPSKSQTIALG